MEKGRDELVYQGYWGKAVAQSRMKCMFAALARAVNGWSMNTDTTSVYGSCYLKRANKLYW